MPQHEEEQFITYYIHMHLFRKTTGFTKLGTFMPNKKRKGLYKE